MDKVLSAKIVDEKPFSYPRSQSSSESRLLWSSSSLHSHTPTLFLNKFPSISTRWSRIPSGAFAWLLFTSPLSMSNKFIYYLLR